jgi:hypothetical protein
MPSSGLLGCRGKGMFAINDVPAIMEEAAPHTKSANTISVIGIITFKSTWR